MTSPTDEELIALARGPQLRGPTCNYAGLNALLDALADRLEARGVGEAVAWRPTHRHVKRGTDYQVLGVGQSQGTLADDDPVVIYRGEDGGLWARHQAEFLDGRFQFLPPPPSQEGS